MALEVTSDLTVRMKHARMCDFCSSGVRDWFAQKGLDYGSFLTNGIPATTLAAYEDPLADRMIQAAIKEQENAL